MKQFSYVLTHETALHSRMMNLLSHEASRFESCIELVLGEKRSRLGANRIPTDLRLHSGSHVTVTVEGRDEEAAVAAMQDYFVTNM